MTREERCSRIAEAVENIRFPGDCLGYSPFGSGHINDTFLIRFRQEDGSVQRYVLQRINHEIFRDPVGLMENISRVTAFLREKILENRGDPERETLNIVPAKDGGNLYRDGIGSYWRAYRFIENASCLDQVRDPSDFYESAVAFGRFQKLLADFPAATLRETIPDFHNTPDRFRRFRRAVDADVCGRAESAQKEIAFFLEREKDAGVLDDLYRQGTIPLRVTHNDTKLNNVMLDGRTGRAVCVIDLDTVMPGFSVNDFGDSIRFGASTAAEDERDLSKVRLDLGLYGTYLEGYLKGCGGSLTDGEIAALPEGARLMTLECGVRFLTDYLQGDTYFKTERPGQNLDRCRTQMKLAADMEENLEKMRNMAVKPLKKAE